ncbi:MAG: leucine-rich repeat protein [Lentisphaerae bacterium]|nr:leucine-rich repeat protein [Lentisphaerota bacterium]
MMSFSAGYSSKRSVLLGSLLRRFRTAVTGACIGVAFLFAGMLQAAEIRPEQALIAVGNWLRHTRQRPLATPLNRSADSVQSICDEQGRALGHVVALQDGGFVITGADDAVAPIISFAAKGDFPSDPKHPLCAILQRDLPRRQAGAERRRANPATRQSAGAMDHAAQWQALLTPWENTRGGLDIPDDLRVGPLLQSAWGQGGFNIYSDDGERILIPVFAYYTPHNYWSGCVATAGAQLMRFHEYPDSTKPVEKLTKECKVDGVPQALTMFGGIYDWANMPLKPNAGTIKSQRRAIGKLCYDVAVSVEMAFASEVSLANMQSLTESLCDTFHFASAKHFWCGSEQGDADCITETVYYRDMLLSNFDAGYPVAVGLGGDGGHALVGDGYGFHGGRLYVHLNMGWEGQFDAWYNLPTVEIDGYFIFTVFDELIFNVFPDFNGELISGRVTDMAGQPLAAVAVTAQDAATRAVVAEATTNERGIYALKIPAPAQGAYHVRATFRGAAEMTTVDGIVDSNDYNVINPAENDIRVAIGSRWGVDFQLAPLPFLYTVTNETVSITGYDNGPADVIVPATLEGLPVVAIAAGAFQGLDALTSVVLPDSVASVGVDAFADCLNLQSITFGRGLTELGEGALQNCPALAGIVVPSENDAFALDAAGVLFSHDFSALHRYPPARGGDSYELPATVRAIQPYAFDGCAELSTLTLPAGLEAIGDVAFGDSGFTEFVFPGAPPTLGAAPFPTAAVVRCYENNAAWDDIKTFGGCPVEKIAVFHSVSFALGDKGRTEPEDEDLLTQQVRHGTAATAPAVITDSPWVFSSWDADYSVVLGDMTIHARYAYQRKLDLVAGWQVVGLNLVPDEACVKALAAEKLLHYDAVGTAFVRPAGVASDYAPGRAYWLFRQEAGGTLTLRGDLVEASSLLPSAPGWHFVAVVADCAGLPAGITDAWQWCDGRYVRATALASGEGYWLYCLEEKQ